MKRRSFLKAIAGLFGAAATPGISLTIPPNEDGAEMEFNPFPEYRKCLKCRGKAKLGTLDCCHINLPDPDTQASRIRMGYVCTRCGDYTLYRIGFKHVSWWKNGYVTMKDAPKKHIP